MSSDYSILDQMLTQKNLREIIKRSTSDILEKCIDEFISPPESRDMTLHEVMERLLDILRRGYHNEYYMPLQLLLHFLDLSEKGTTRFYEIMGEI